MLNPFSWFKRLDQKLDTLQNDTLNIELRIASMENVILRSLNAVLEKEKAMSQALDDLAAQVAKNNLYKKIRQEYFTDRNAAKAIDALVQAGLFDTSGARNIVSSWQESKSKQLSSAS